MSKSAGRETEWIPQTNGGVRAGDWPETIPLYGKTPHPIDAKVLPGVLDEYSQALAVHTETAIELSILAVLGATSVAVSGKVEIEAESGYTEPANMWLCALLESGSRKTAVIDAIRAPIDNYQESERQRLEPGRLAKGSRLGRQLGGRRGADCCHSDGR